LGGVFAQLILERGWNFPLRKLEALKTMNNVFPQVKELVIVWNLLRLLHIKNLGFVFSQPKIKKVNK